MVYLENSYFRRNDDFGKLVIEIINLFNWISMLDPTLVIIMQRPGQVARYSSFGEPERIFASTVMHDN